MNKEVIHVSGILKKDDMGWVHFYFTLPNGKEKSVRISVQDYAEILELMYYDKREL